LNDYLMVRSRDGLTTALVVDEAQLLSWDLLEEIRLLTNLETSQHKLLQIVLSGQPELDTKLDSQKLRQLKQRVGLRCNLLPLELKEVEGYIHRRLQLAGATGNENAIFSREAIEAIYRASKGIPRLVNTLCENCMMLGFGLQLDQITPAVVREVVSDFRLDQSADPLAADGESRSAVEGIPNRTDRVPAEPPPNASHIPTVPEWSHVPTLSEFLSQSVTGLTLKAPDKVRQGMEARETVEPTQTVEMSKSVRESEKRGSLPNSDNADSLEEPRSTLRFPHRRDGAA